MQKRADSGIIFDGLKWMKAAGNSVTNTVKEIGGLPGEAVERINAEIAAKEEEIGKIEETLKLRKAELKELQKAKAKAEKEKEKIEAAEQKKQLVEAVMNSGKSVDEILAFLRGQS